MTIETSKLTITAITDAELARIEGILDAQTALIKEQALLIAQLEAGIPPQPPQPPPTTALNFRAACEVSYGDAEASYGAYQLVALIKSLGFDAVSPLFGQWTTPQGVTLDWGTVTHVRTFLAACSDHRVKCIVNADQHGGRDWLVKPDIVQALNDYADNVIVRCEVESDPDGTIASQAWVDDAAGMVRQLNAAGIRAHKQVGAPQGGRRAEYPLKHGSKVLYQFPIGSVSLNTQLYWGAGPEDTWYSSRVGLAAGLAGAKACLQRIKDSGMPFTVGLCARNYDVGLNDEPALIDECLRLGIPFFHWELSRDSIAENNLFTSWDLKTLTPTGVTIRDRLKR